jgi:hypothetical protein
MESSVPYGGPASVPDETAYKSEAKPMQSQPTHHGQVRVRCRFPLNRIRPIIDAAKAASVPNEPAHASEADFTQSQPTRDGHVRNRTRTRKVVIRPIIDAARAGSDPEEPAYESVLIFAKSHPARKGPVEVGVARGGQDPAGAKADMADTSLRQGSGQPDLW